VLYHDSTDRDGEGIVGLFLLDDYPATRRVLETGQFLLIHADDPNADPAECAFLKKHGYESVLLMPLMARKDVIGLIELYPAPGTSPFSESALQLAHSLNAQAAIALDNARLHAEAQTRTGLANRRAFDHALEAEINRAGRHGYPLSLLILDIDSFKLYNDAFGHPAGDERIKAIADLLMRNMRGPDIAARYGGEEFAVILPHTNKSGALTLAERIRAAAQAQAPAPASGSQPVSGYTLSIGVATFPEDGLTPDAVLLAADNAELAGKRAGKNCVTAALAIS
jgi:diguanylate cyclase (GGDEF)-like protein